MTDWMTWAVPLGLYAASFLHHGWAWRRHAKTADLEASQQKRLEMFREVCALLRYGAREEALELLDECIEIGESEVS